MNEALHGTAQVMVSRPRGILAADESIGTMSSRLEKAGVEGSTEYRRAYREMLLTTPGLDNGISGVILSDETFHQRLSDGNTFPLAVHALNILPGIKVDTGAKPLALSPGEKVTEGLDRLRERLADYVSQGARFAKWRAVIIIGDRQANPQRAARQRPRAGPVRRAVPGERVGAHRRAGSINGW